MGFATSLDIVNRGLQHCGVPRITLFTDLSRQAAETSFCYDKLRLAELRRSVWRFATRRATLRPITATTTRIVPPAYASGTAYLAGQLVQDSGGVYWICLLASTGNTPGTDTVGQPPFWTQYFGALTADTFSTAVTYAAGEIVISGGALYLSLINANLNHTPASSQWVALTGTTQSAIFLPIPAGVGYTSGTATARTLYRLPNGFMRLAAPDPKRPGQSNLATSGAIQYMDWQFEGDYLVSTGTDPILMRFVADLSYVPSFDPLFCEGLGARVGYEVVEMLTQSPNKKQVIGQTYSRFIREARMVNAIEIGDTEDNEDAYSAAGGTTQATAGRDANGPIQQQQQGGQ